MTTQQISRMHAIPRQLHTAAETRRLDQHAIASGTPGIVLMKRAGRAVFDALRAHWPDARRVTVVCGKGNNAGDGYVVGGLAHGHGLRVRLLQIGAAANLQGDAARARDWATAQGVTVVELDAEQPALALDGDVVVDALLGTGVQGEVRGGFRSAIEQINGGGVPVLAVDLPSGLCPDRGTPLGVAVSASVTVTLIGAKRGLFTGAGRELAGAIVYDSCGVAADILIRESGIPALRWQELRPGLPQRGANAHKGQSGHVVVVGGERGMGGAVAMTAEAALRAGAGLVSVATRPEHVPVVLGRRPELMVRGLDEPGAVRELLARANVIAVGPGLGQTGWSRGLLQEVLTAAASSGRALVVDADALNLIAADALPLPDHTIVTPHPGEAARLLGRSVSAVQADRFDAAAALAARDGGLAVLKGAGTVVAGQTLLGVCVDGNAGMASAGMGDVLTGVIAGLWAQGLDRDQAGTLGVALHAAAGDHVAHVHGMRGMTATDLMPALRELLNGR